MDIKRLTFPERIERLRRTSKVLQQLAQTSRVAVVATQLTDAADVVRVEVEAMEKAARQFMKRVTERRSRRSKDRTAA
jgi:hypothetical protein